MSSEVRDAYIRATCLLSKSNPDAWATFMEAFKAYTAYELERITSATPEMAQIAIGSGRKIKELRDEFIDIEKLVEKIKR